MAASHVFAKIFILNSVKQELHSKYDAINQL